MFPFLISAVVAIIDCKINFIYAGSKGIDTLFSNLINVFALKYVHMSLDEYINKK